MWFNDEDDQVSSATPTPSQNEIAVTASSSVTPAGTSTRSTVPAGYTAGSAALRTYTDLVAQYEGRRIQFDINCQAVPGQLTFKNGTKIMIDNRSGDPRSVKIGNQQYNLKGYGYQIITLSSSSLPSTLMINCGAAVNSGQILLQR